MKQFLSKLFLLFLIPLLSNHINANEYHIIDLNDLITPEQEASIKKVQDEVLENHDTLLSYAFYNSNSSKSSMKYEWETNLNDYPASDKFHLFICVGIYSTRNTIDIYYKNPPVLQDTDDLSTCISSLSRNLRAEPDIEELILNSSSIISGSLSYINERPKYEANTKRDADKSRADEFMKYILKLTKIALWIITPIIALIIIWYIISFLNNKRAYHFPEAQPNSIKKRLRATSAATSISRSRK